MANHKYMLLALVVVGLAGLVSSYTLKSNKDDSKKVVCYFGSWATYRPGDGKYDVENIDPMICTHLIFGFAGLGNDNKIYALDAYNELEENWGKGAYKRFTKLKERNPRLKTLLAIGGWNEGSEKYSNMAATAGTRRTFIDSVIPFLQHENFDGLDLDWEYPADRGGKPEDKQNFALLCQEMRAEFDKYGYLLTAAVSAGEYTIANAYDIPSISQSLDFINVMAYDFRGAWEHHPYTGHQAAFDANDMDAANGVNDTKLNVKYALEYWRDNGADPNKLIVGLPTYGRGFTLSDPSNTGFYSPSNLGIPAGPFTRESGFWGYNEICEELRKGGWNTVKDPKVVGPYSYKNNWWIGYDDVDAILFKSQWLKDEGYGGAMFWSLETDDFHGRCGESNILIKAAFRTLIGEVEPEPTTTVDPTAPTTTTTTTQAPATPPPDSKCSYSGEFLGEKCDPSFTICNWNGNNWDYITHACNPPLYYDPNIKQCNWGDVIGCARH